MSIIIIVRRTERRKETTMTISELMSALSNAMNTYGDIEVAVYDSYAMNEGWNIEGIASMALDNDNINVVDNVLVLGADEYDIA
jgi:hypothetical protein